MFFVNSFMIFMGLARSHVRYSNVSFLSIVMLKVIANSIMKLLIVFSLVIDQ